MVIETDCASVAGKIKSNSVDKSLTSAVISNVKEEMARRHVCSVHKISRDQNKIAHVLAQFAVKSRTSKASFSFVPTCIQELVYQDRQRCRDVSGDG